MQEIYKALKGWVYTLSLFQRRSLDARTQWPGSPIGHAPILKAELCICTKIRSMQRPLGSFQLLTDLSSKGTVRTLTHYPGSECFSMGGGPRIASKSPRVKLQSVRSVCPLRLYLPRPRAVQLTAAHLASALCFSTCIAVWGPGFSHLQWAAVLCSRLHPLIRFINRATNSCSSFYQTLWESIGKKVHHIHVPQRGSQNRCSL